MIICKKWKVVFGLGLKSIYWQGWFLFGILPLYIRRLD